MRSTSQHWGKGASRGSRTDDNVVQIVSCAHQLRSSAKARSSLSLHLEHRNEKGVGLAAPAPDTSMFEPGRFSRIATSASSLLPTVLYFARRKEKPQTRALHLRPARCFDREIGTSNDSTPPLTPLRRHRAHQSRSTFMVPMLFSSSVERASIRVQLHANPWQARHDNVSHTTARVSE